MILWRISDHPDLDGAGGLLAPGRWHKAGSRVIYCAPNPATALVETLVHVEIDSEDLADPLQYLEIEAPDGISTETVSSDALGQNWRLTVDSTRELGNGWLGSGHTALLLVPSAVVPATRNVLINPRHPESPRVRIVRVHRHSIDQRLLKTW